MLTHDVERVSFADAAEIYLNTLLPELNRAQRSIKFEFVAAN